MKRAIITISDLHIGSHSGLTSTEGIQLDNGATQLPSKLQFYVSNCWEHFWTDYVSGMLRKYQIRKKNATVVINGDVVDGNHHNAVDIVPNVGTQEREAVRILKPIAEQYRTFMVRGTEAHGSVGEQSTERIGRELGCEMDDCGNNSVWQLWLEAEGVLFQFAHHIGTTSSAAYETSAPMRELVAGLVESAQWKQRMPDVFVRSHRHRYIPVSIPAEGDKDIQLVITPGWQLRTPFVEKIDRMRLPHIGGVIFIVEDGQCQTLKKIYSMPKPTVIQI
ncbi:MAG: hypothetical protein AB9897_01260 [Anaerolineaceae bacterium]